MIAEVVSGCNHALAWHDRWREGQGKDGKEIADSGASAARKGRGFASRARSYGEVWLGTFLTAAGQGVIDFQPTLHGLFAHLAEHAL